MPWRILCGLVCLGVCSWGGTECQLRKKPHPIQESTFGMPVELDPSFNFSSTLPYKHTNSYRISCNIQDVSLCWYGGSFRVGMPLWYVVRLTTYLDLLSVFKIQRSDMTISRVFINNTLLSESQHLASYVSRQNAMAYDTRPHEWSYQTWRPYRKNLQEGKKTPLWSGWVIKDVRIILLSQWSVRFVWE